MQIKNKRNREREEIQLQFPLDSNPKPRVYILNYKNTRFLKPPKSLTGKIISNKLESRLKIDGVSLSEKRQLSSAPANKHSSFFCYEMSLT